MSSLSRIDVVVGAATLALAASVAVPGLLWLREAGMPVRCSNNIRQLALAAIQYADDKRFYPHVRRTLELDGGYETNHTPKVVRSLLWFGYDDNPEAWICPWSSDSHRPVVDDDVREQMRLWFWGGAYLRASNVSPLKDARPDPILAKTTELSYGWTRRGLNCNAPSTRPLGADKALRAPDINGVEGQLAGSGNHPNGWNVVYVDATVQFHSADLLRSDEEQAAIFRDLPVADPEAAALPEWPLPTSPYQDRRSAADVPVSLALAFLVLPFPAWIWGWRYARRRRSR